jgi:hypothetical protein
MTIKMIADMTFTYGKRQLKAGDDFTATAGDAFALAVFRRAHRAAGDGATADLVAAGKKTRRYRRRDMRAEDPS